MGRIVLLALLLMACGRAAQAVDVLRCVAGDGSVVYQDRPCPAGQSGERLRLPDDPAPPVDPSTPAPVAAPPAESAPAEPIAAAEAGPRFLLCTRADGSQYISDDGWIGGTGVPYGMVGGSGLGLAEVYGGRHGAGVSAPGLRTIPRIPAANRPYAGAMIWIDDQCHEAAPHEACAWLARRHRDVTRKLEHAFSDQTPQLEQEQAALRERMRGCG